MAYPLWPSDFQEFLNVESFSYEFGSDKVRTEMEIGIAKVRARSTRSVDQLSCSVVLPVALFTMFRTFYKTTLNQGVTPFTFNHPFTQVPTDFRFVGNPKLTPLNGGINFTLSMTWEEMPNA